MKIILGINVCIYLTVITNIVSSRPQNETWWLNTELTVIIHASGTITIIVH